MLAQVPASDVVPFRLDYVFGSMALARHACGIPDGTAVQCRVLADASSFELSDHFPVECDVAWDTVWGAREQMMEAAMGGGE